MDEIRDESWREGPSGALLVFRHTWTMADEPVLKQIDVPANITLETVGDWLRQSYPDWGDKYTVLSVTTEDVFLVGHVHDEVVVHNIKSTVH